MSDPLTKQEQISALQRAERNADAGMWLSALADIRRVIASLRAEPSATLSRRGAEAQNESVSEEFNNTPNAKIRLGHLKEAVAWAYQFAGAWNAPVEALDNLSAVARGIAPQHGWPVVRAEPSAEQEREECARIADQVADDIEGDIASETVAETIASLIRARTASPVPLVAQKGAK